MKTKLIGLLVLVGLLVSAIPVMSADYGFSTYLTYKNPVTWEELYIKNTPVLKAKIYLKGFGGSILTASGTGLEPLTHYTLIYYGDAAHNDVWNYATCIPTKFTNSFSVKTSTLGQLSANTFAFDYSSFIGDEVAQKFWLVPSSDVDCIAGKMTSWNPTRILFEHETV